MAEKFELPNAQVSRLIKEGAYDSLTSTQANRMAANNAPDGSVIISKEVKHAMQQIGGLFILYL